MHSYIQHTEIHPVTVVTQYNFLLETTGCEPSIFCFYPSFICFQLNLIGVLPACPCLYFSSSIASAAYIVLVHVFLFAILSQGLFSQSYMLRFLRSQVNPDIFLLCSSIKPPLALALRLLLQAKTQDLCAWITQCLLTGFLMCRLPFHQSLLHISPESFSKAVSLPLVRTLPSLFIALAIKT